MTTATANEPIIVVGVPASHPTAAIEAALRLKALPYRRVDRIPVAHKIQQRLLYGRSTVPAIRIGGRRLAGSETILNALDELRPDPPMFETPTTRDDFRWAETALQDRARRLVWHGLSKRPTAMREYARDSRMPLPTPVAMLFARPVIAAEVAIHSARPQAVDEDLRALPAALERADELIAAADDPQSRPDAAILSITSSVALLRTMQDLEAVLRGRPSTRVSAALFPDAPGRLPSGTLAVPGPRMSATVRSIASMATPSTPSRRDRRKQRTTASILDAASELYFAQGVQRTTVDEFAARADVSVGSVDDLGAAIRTGERYARRIRRRPCASSGEHGAASSP